MVNSGINFQVGDVPKINKINLSNILSLVAPHDKLLHELCKQMSYLTLHNP